MFRLATEMMHAVFDALSLSQSTSLTSIAPVRGGRALRPLPGFDLSFATPSLPMPPGADGRQSVAADGKILPESGMLTELVEGAEDMDDAEAVLAWLPDGAIAAIIPEPESAAAAAAAGNPTDEPANPASAPLDLVSGQPVAGSNAGLPDAEGPIELPRAMAPTPPTDVQLALEPATGADIAPDLPSAPVQAARSGGTPSAAFTTAASGLAPSVQSAPQGTATPVEIIVPRDLATRATTDRSVAHPRDTAPTPSPAHGFDLRSAAVTPLAPAATTPTPATIVASAAQLFASAITGGAGQGTRGEPAPAADPAQLAQAALGARAPVTAMSATDQAPLDLTREDWTGQMIERIATLRDSAEAADTRIKLAPENLGALDISIRRDGDRIHVHFNAENPAARQLLSEAAPRLAELAEARGVKLGQTSVDSGTGGQQGQPRQQQQATPARPVAASAQAMPQHTDHQRIA